MSASSSSSSSSSSSTTFSSSSSSAAASSIFSSPEWTRLVTIIAHVDHGKTTLADHLIESNGIISERHAGTLRFLDWTPEEQRRGITIRASAIALFYSHTAKSSSAASAKQPPSQQQPPPPPQQDMVMHLVDSPGHVDFSWEVSSALQLCDGVILVVDAVEGLGARTHSLLREAYKLQMTPLLIINKVDRLCTELALTPTEAYIHLCRLLESINAATAALHVSSRWTEEEEEEEETTTRTRDDLKSTSLETTSTARTAAAAAHSPNDKDNNDDDENNNNKTKKEKKEKKEKKDSNNDNDDDDDDDLGVWNFDPCQGNVVFASAYYGWGFTVPALAKSLFRSQTIPMKPAFLKKILWGDYHYHAETQKVTKWKYTSQTQKQPLFSQYALQPLWNIYEGTSTAATFLGMTTAFVVVGGGSNTTTTAAAAAATTTRSSGSGSGNLAQQQQQQEENNKKKKNKPDTRLMPDTVGMSRVWEALQWGSTHGGAAEKRNKKNDNYKESWSLMPGVALSEEATLRFLCKRYRPLAQATLHAVAEICPSPRRAVQDARAPFWTPSHHQQPQPQAAAAAAAALKACDPSCPWTLAHISKFVSLSKSLIVKEKDMDFMACLKEKEEEDESLLFGFTRVLSGTLTRSNNNNNNNYYYYYLLGPKHSEETESMQCRVRLYLFMGSSLVAVDAVPAGHLCATLLVLKNNEPPPFKSMTLSSQPHAMPLLTSFGNSLQPLVKVNVEAQHASDTAALERGLMRLSLADAAVQVTATAKGERLLACLGEVHLAQSLQDLQQVYACGVPLDISDPIVDFGESVVWWGGKEESATTTIPGEEDDNDIDNVEVNDYAAFFDGKLGDGTLSKPLRQTQIPPYCYEEGIAQGYAQQGRCRFPLSGRGAALSLRVLPLASSVLQCLQTKRVVELQQDNSDASDELVRLVTALGFFSSLGRGRLSPSSALEVLSQTICTMDFKNGNAMMETPGFQSGKCIKGVLSLSLSSGEIYMPMEDARQQDKDKDEEEEEEEDNNKKKKNDKNDTTRLGHDVEAGKEEYQALRLAIREGWPIQDDENKTTMSTTLAPQPPQDEAAHQVWKSALRGSAVAGFQQAMRAGPLCEEPVYGVLVVLEGLEIAMRHHSNGHKNESLLEPTKPLAGGMMVSALTSGIRCAMLTRPVRLVESHLRLTLHSSLEGQGSLYAVLSKRRGKVLSDDLVDGTNLLAITASLPQAESFGLAPELLKKSSGQVTAPELVLDQWAILPQDPFWIPTSVEEREDYGEFVVGNTNDALRYIRQVRARKGLLVDSQKIVVAAEKQRTLARKK